MQINRQIGGLYKLIERELKVIYWTEKILAKTLPKLADYANYTDLKDLIDDHYFETENQIQRILNAFEYMGLDAKSRKCPPMEGILKKTEYIINTTQSGIIKDAAIIAATQKIDHFQIASYTILYTLAKGLGKMDAALLFNESLEEEKFLQKNIQDIYYKSINA